MFYSTRTCLRNLLPEVEIRTAQEMGWGGLRNGDILRLAAETFDVLLTVDQRMRYQQNIRQFNIGIVVIETFDTTIENLRELLPKNKLGLANVTEGTVLVIKT